MKPLPKSLIVVAFIFFVDALICDYLTAHNLVTFLMRFHVTLELYMTESFTAGFTAATIGILRLAPWARLLGCWLSVGALIFITWIFILLGWPAFHAPDVPSVIGLGLVNIFCYLWLGSPLYILLRRKRDFKKAGPLDRDAPLL